MSEISTVLFDCGGVFTPDPYETILLHEEHGVGRKLGLTLDELVAAVLPVWDKYAILPDANETEFWQEMGDALGLPIDHAEIERVKKEVIALNPTALPTLQYLGDKGVRMGIISNNTSFFYPYQKTLLPIDEFIDPRIEFLSQTDKLTKSDGLFELAATRVNPAETLVIDDRASNITAAHHVGFQAVQYSMFTDGSLLDLVQQYIPA